MPASARLKTFGAPALLSRGEGSESVPIPRIPMAVLAVIAAEERSGITRDRLTGLFWPESPESNAKNLLNNALLKARQALGTTHVVLQGAAALQLDPAILTSDVAEFESALAAGELERAVAAYGGRFLDGLDLGDRPEVARWAAARRDTLAGRCLDALLTLARRAIEARDAERAR
ncbi:MAG TPA: hypothetical protein VMT93_05695, partial [Gemmatimonadaceae bacterium]|nr:hypothetical protein [Gemmatimonadaceae bacterium]